MSTEQELAAVAEAIWEQRQRDGRIGSTTFEQAKMLPHDLWRVMVEEVKTDAATAIAAVNTVRAEQASAGDAALVDRLISMQRAADAAQTPKGLIDATQARDELRAAVLARMQRPVIDDAMVERAVDGYYRTLCTMAGTAYSPSITAMRAALEAALRAEDEA
jgi:hypothetical protein